MPLYEFSCHGCHQVFEQISRINDPEHGVCPRCQRDCRADRIISGFWVGGRGDLRESTLHGCHDCSVSPGGLAGSHYGHGDESAAGNGAQAGGSSGNGDIHHGHSAARTAAHSESPPHIHGPGCGHS